MPNKFGMGIVGIANFIRNLAKVQTEAGASYIDVCASVKDDIEVETMKWLIDRGQEVTETPIAVDSSNTRVCVECMGLCNKIGLPVVKENE